jgi:hypothetical protein
LSDAFTQLNDDDQKAAVDVSVATVVLGLRISSTGQALYDWVATEFATSRSIPSNLTKYALRDLGKVLLKEDWTLLIEKSGEQVTTHFTPQNKRRILGDDSQ